MTRQSPAARVVCTVGLVALLTLQAATLRADDAAAPMTGLGLQLMVTAEPQPDQSMAVSLNSLPLLIELQATRRVGVRFNSTVNMQVLGHTTGVSHVGGGLSVPIYLGMSDDRPGTGWLLGPHLGATWNFADNGPELTLAAEGGARWVFVEHLAFGLALQLGASWLGHRAPDQQLVPHIGIFPSLNYWF